MAKDVNFPWEEEVVFEEKKTENITKKQKVINFINKFQTVIVVFILILIVILSSLGGSKKTTLSKKRTISVLMPMIAIAKGNKLPTDILREVSIYEKSLTKSQKFKAITKEELLSLTGKLIANKNLSTNNPLLWSDVKYINQTKMNKKIIKPKLQPSFIYGNTINNNKENQ